MKVLFAVNNENISEAIIKKYQKIYGELLEYKNVYYYNAIVKELQRSKDYDIIVINEDLETFSSNDANKVDSFILTKLENIVAVFKEGGHRTIPVIFVSNSKRTKEDQMLPNVFNLNIYNMLVGKDRTITAICNLINSPRNEAEARAYYGLGTISNPGIETEIVSIKEMNNILKYYKKTLGKTEEYSSIFNKIIPQYDDEQLKYIIQRLPKEVTDVLEKENTKYNEILELQKTETDTKKNKNKKVKAKKESKIIIPSVLGKNKDKLDSEDEYEDNQLDVDEEEILDTNEMEEEAAAVEEEKIVIPNELIKDGKELKQEDEEEQYSLLEDDIIKIDDNENLEPINENINTNINIEEESTESIVIPEDMKSDKALKEEIESEKQVEEKLPEEIPDEDIIIEAGEDNYEEYVPIFEDTAEDLNTISQKVEIPEFGSEEIEKQNKVELDKAHIDKKIEKQKEEKTSPEKDLITEEANKEAEIIIENEEEVTDMLSNKETENIEDDEIDIFGNNQYFKLDNEETIEEISLEVETDKKEEVVNKEENKNKEIEEKIEESPKENKKEKEIKVEAKQTDKSNSSFAKNEDNEISDLIGDILGFSDEDDKADDLDFSDETEIIIEEEKEEEPEIKLEPEVETKIKNDKPEAKKDESQIVETRKEAGIQTESKIPNKEVENPVVKEDTKNISSEAKQQVTIPVEMMEESKEIIKKTPINYDNNELSAMLSKDKKVVAFVGTSKNGTSFLINSLAMLFASIGINTAILDMTQNRNSYYMCTKNDEKLRKIAIDSIDNLENNVSMGVPVARDLTVYTALPGNNIRYTNADRILSTLAKNHSLVLIDTDFETDHSFFALAQEIYLVQSLDILTIQPLTLFLKELLDEEILTSDKVRVVINKEIGVKGLTKKILVGGISTYNSPSMSIMTNLFDRNTVPVCSIPFDQTVYSKYLENIIECKYDISGYPKRFIDTLKVLANMVYPLISRQRDVGVTDTSFMGNNSMSIKENKKENAVEVKDMTDFSHYEKGFNKVNQNQTQNVKGKMFSNDIMSTLENMKNNF